MHFHFVFVDETKNRAYRELESDYIKRIKRYCRVTVHIVKGVKLTNAVNDARVRKIEGERLLEKVPASALIIALDQRGKQRTSEQLAQQVQIWQNQSVQHLAFLIGGPLGFDEAVIQKANLVLSLSKMTLVHEMARVFLAEQLYRAWSILRNEKYHKG